MYCMAALSAAVAATTIESGPGQMPENLLQGEEAQQWQRGDEHRGIEHGRLSLQEVQVVGGCVLAPAEDGHDDAEADDKGRSDNRQDGQSA